MEQARVQALAAARLLRSVAGERRIRALTRRVGGLARSLACGMDESAYARRERDAGEEER